jgi:hypothetical protein
MAKPLKRDHSIRSANSMWSPQAGRSRCVLCEAGQSRSASDGTARRRSGDWGMPAINYDLMYQTMLRDTAGLLTNPAVTPGSRQVSIGSGPAGRGWQA